MDKFFTDFDFFWNLIETKENFTFARYADGEVLLMKGSPVGEATQAFAVDRWSAPDTLTKVGQELLRTLKHTEPNYYYAISGKNDNVHDYNFLKGNIQQVDDKISFVNLWINANYGRMKEKLLSLQREVILICNEKVDRSKLPFNVLDVTAFPDDCINFWESNSEAYLDQQIKKYGEVNNQLFLIACGPVSEIIIDYLYTLNPNNTYIDVGSSIDEIVHGKVTRPYMVPTSIYYNLISHF